MKKICNNDFNFRLFLTYSISILQEPYGPLICHSFTLSIQRAFQWTSVMQIKMTWAWVKMRDLSLLSELFLWNIMKVLFLWRQKINWVTITAFVTALQCWASVTLLPCVFVTYSEQRANWMATSFHPTCGKIFYFNVIGFLWTTKQIPFALTPLLVENSRRGFINTKWLPQSQELICFPSLLSTSVNDRKFLRTHREKKHAMWVKPQRKNRSSQILTDSTHTTQNGHKI